MVSVVEECPGIATNQDDLGLWKSGHFGSPMGEAEHVCGWMMHIDGMSSFSGSRTGE